MKTPLASFFRITIIDHGGCSYRTRRIHALQGRPEAQNKANGLGYQPWLVGLLGIEGMAFEMAIY